MTATPPNLAPREDAELQRPSRPALVELSAAVLIVTGVLGAFASLNSAPGLPSGNELALAVGVVLDAIAVALGLLIRLGRAWLVTVNYVAVVGFLDLLGAGASPLPLMLGLADVSVVAILIATKPWFDAVRAYRAAVAMSERRA